MRVCDEQSRQGETVPSRRCAETKCRHEQIFDLTGGNSDGRKKQTKCNFNFKNFAAFTLAEILLSLTVIGIVAAIALPSLLGNANERAWETQKKALYTRFSQALPLLPSLNGYGEFEGTPASGGYFWEQGYTPQNITKDTSAESFIRDGLSKVMKITNICAIPEGVTGNNAAKYISDCGLPEKIIPMDNSAAIELKNILSLSKFNYHFEGYTNDQPNTKAAAFETANGESILVYYNPICVPYMLDPEIAYYGGIYTQSKLCANFVYDLNGKKGPNTVGKDIGFIVAMYSADPLVLAPNPYPQNLSELYSQYDAPSKCKEMDENAKLPNVDELNAIVYNAKLLGNFILSSSGHQYWSSTIYNSKSALYVNQNCTRNRGSRTNVNLVRCIKR